MEEIILFSSDGNVVPLKLNNEKKSYVVEEILEIKSMVYSDVSYSLSLNSEEEIKTVKVFLNGELADTVYKDGIVEFIDDNRFPFGHIIGLVQLSLAIEYENSRTEWGYSEYASVLIKPSKLNKSLDSMLRYVYENQTDILYHEEAVSGIGKSFDRSYDDFWSQIVLLEEIANVYENSYGYFMANCRTKLEREYVLDRAEKLQDVDSSTIQYIVQHPEYLHESVNGIKSGSRAFLPTKTLMSQKRITNDIYENQVVISFLEHLLSEIKGLADKIKSYLRLIQIDKTTDDGYIISSYLLYVNAKETLNEFLEKTKELEKQYRKLVTSYSSILSVKRLSMVKRPEPTHVFMNIPQYRKIYTCITRWFRKSGYDLIKERVMLSFINAPSIYEAYVLTKLINQIKDYGYTLDDAKLVNYPRQPNWRFSNKKYNNTFVFSNSNSRITLYYEPIVYDEDRSSVNNLFIYRNNSVSLSRDVEEERQGHYYVPDYILKYEADGKERYLICDAKFSNIKKVQYQLMPDLIYKYITSLSPVNEDVEMGGLFVFYGLVDDGHNTESFYDKQIRSVKRITPRIEMVPLSEVVSYSKQQENSLGMLEILCS